MVHPHAMTLGSSTVEVRIHGAAGEVTGSCYEVIAPRTRLLVDFGMFQGTSQQEMRNAEAPDVEFASVDAVIVTHAHVDHCGRLGMLPRLGFAGPIFATEPTAELLPRVLISSASLQQLRVEEARAGRQPVARVVEPLALAMPHPGLVQAPPVLFFHRDADRIRKALRALPFMEWEPVADGVEMRFLHASHVIGAASVELRIERSSGGSPIHLLFSGDIGPISNPLLAPHQWPERTPDLLIMESTNGARRFPRTGQLQSLESTLTSARERGERVLVPVFALGRAQSVLFMIAQASHDGVLGDLPVYLDSAMGARASELYARHPHLLEPEVRRACMRGQNPLHFPQLHTLMSRKESESLDRVRSGCVILAGSGFCDAGPILRHMKLAIDRPDTRILFVGHQPEGLLGDGLLRGATKVEIDGAVLEVRAKVERIEGLSGHGDAADLLEWVRRMPGMPACVAITHGSLEARAAFAQELSAAGAPRVESPMVGDSIAVA
ncbi:MAG: MBL fold metallo-hydrolase [Phycisphaerales bacterium]|nr:MBL fold metallo-hydrolase [Phycisphaerales bacterium]